MSEESHAEWGERRRRREQERLRALAAGDHGPAAEPAAHDAAPQVSPPPSRPLSRRELRERALAAEQGGATDPPPAPPVAPGRATGSSAERLSRRALREGTAAGSAPERPVTPVVQPPATTGGIRRVEADGGLSDVRPPEGREGADRPSPLSPQARAAAIRAQAARAQAEREEAARLGAERAQAQRSQSRDVPGPRSAPGPEPTQQRRPTSPGAGGAPVEEPRTAGRPTHGQGGTRPPGPSGPADGGARVAGPVQAGEQPRSALWDRGAWGAHAGRGSAGEPTAAPSHDATAAPSRHGARAAGTPVPERATRQGQAVEPSAVHPSAPRGTAPHGTGPGVRGAVPQHGTAPAERPASSPAAGPSLAPAGRAAWAPRPPAVEDRTETFPRPPGADPRAAGPRSSTVAVVPERPVVGEAFGVVTLPSGAVTRTPVRPAENPVEPSTGEAPTVGRAPRWSDIEAPAASRSVGAVAPVEQPAVETAHEAEDHVEDEPDPGVESQHPYSWFHLLILILAAFVMGMLIFLVIVNDQGPGDDSAAATPSVVQATGPDGTPTTETED